MADGEKASRRGRAKKASAEGNGAVATGANLGFEAKLWLAADKLRNNMDAAEYKHVVLGLIFLKYISDAFEEKHAALTADRKSGADPEDPDEYRAENIFWVPKEARWSHLQGNAKQPTIGKLLDDAMLAIERDNPALKAVRPKEYARPALDKQRLGELIDLIGTIGLGDNAIHPLFLFHWMMGRGFLEQVDRVKGQTDMADYVSLRDQRRMVVPLRDRDLQARFVQIVTPLDKRIEHNRREAAQLARVRDALLPRLMSGELRVAVDRVAERAP